MKRRTAIALVVASTVAVGTVVPAGSAGSANAPVDGTKRRSARQAPPQIVQKDAVPFTFDAQRILLPVDMATPDGNFIKQLAWFNMGMPKPVLSEVLYRRLGIENGHPYTVRIGKAEISSPASTVIDGDDKINGDKEFEHYFSPYLVEAVLPAIMFADKVITIDYSKQTFEVSMPGQFKPEGEPVPFAYNAETGFATVALRVDGMDYPFVLDAGSGYTWVRGDVLDGWLAAHPEWRRATGAVGQSNNAMVDYDFEKDGVLARPAQVSVGSVALSRPGMLGTAPLLGRFADSIVGNLFWDRWQKSAVGPVAGWIGGNILKQFKITLDYPHRVSYWKREAPADVHDLDQVGITLVRKKGRFYVGGVVRIPQADGSDTLAAPSFKVGAELLSIDGMAVPGASEQAVLTALHGRPGDVRRITVDQDGNHVEIIAPVKTFN